MYTYVKVFEKGVWCEDEVNAWLHENRFNIRVKDMKLDGTSIVIIYEAKQPIK